MKLTNNQPQMPSVNAKTNNSGGKIITIAPGGRTKPPPSAKAPVGSQPPGGKNAVAAARKGAMGSIKGAPAGKNGVGTGPPQGGGPGAARASTNSGVTLTQAEFDAILTTIGQLKKDKENLLQSLTDPELPTRGRAANQSDDFLPRKRSESDPQPMTSPPTNHLAGIPKSHLTIGEKKRLEWEQQRADEYRRGSEQQRNPLTAGVVPQYAASEPRASRPPTDRGGPAPSSFLPPMDAPLSRAEKKRLQWQRERAEAEAIDAYPPWGRSAGGCGAPIKDLNGNILTDYGTRRPPQLASGERLTVVPQGLQHLFVPSPTEVWKGTTYPAGLTQNLGGSDGAGDFRGLVPPAAMRNTFSLGLLASDSTQFSTNQERQKQEWLDDLARQRVEQQNLKEEEQRRRKAPEHSTWMDASLGQAWAEAPRPPPGPVLAPGGGGNVPRGVGGVAVPPAFDQSGAATSFLHGQRSGQNLDAVTRGELEEKRRKYLENQEFNRRQIEEREQRKRDEKARDLAHDLKFSQSEQAELRDRAGLKIMTRKQQPPTNAVEAEAARMESMRLAIEMARLEAERDKHLRLVSRLHKGNHETANLKPGPEVPSHHTLTTSPRGHGYYDNDPRSSLDAPDSPKKEFGTQTDSRLSAALAAAAAADDDRSNSPSLIEYDPSLSSHRPPDRSGVDRHVRVVSAPKSQRGGGSDVRSLSKGSRDRCEVLSTGGERNSVKPQWGYRNNEGKLAVKQSERDRSFARRQEARLERQRELLEMANSGYHRIPGEGGVAKRNKTAADDRSAGATKRGRSTDQKPGANTASTKNHAAVKDLGARKQNGSMTNGPNTDLGHKTTPPRQRQAPAAQKSPAVPAVRHRANPESNPPSRVDRLVVSESLAPATSYARYSDRAGERGSVVPGEGGGNFVPFVRSSNFLYPADAESPLPVSREPTEMERARRGYQAVINPGKYGRAMERGGGGGGSHPGDALYNPRLVTDQPTDRQGKILQQLSDIRRALMEKQRDLVAGGDAGDGVSPFPPPVTRERIDRAGAYEQRGLSPIRDVM